MRWQAPPRRVSFLSFLASGPPIEEPGCVGMGSVLGQRVGCDRRNPFGQHITERSAFLDARRIVVRIACYTGGGLASHEEFSKLGMSLVEFDIIGRQLAQKLESLLIIFILMPG